jgi:hypothetical protein
MRARLQNIDSLGVARKIFRDKELESQISTWAATAKLLPSFEIARTFHGGTFRDVE